jgi:hypothetical protein
MPMADAWAVAVMLPVIHTQLSSDRYSAVCRPASRYLTGVVLQHNIAAQVVDSLSDGCNNWFYNMSALIFYFYHMEMAAGRELAAVEERIKFRLFWEGREN